MQLTQCKIIDQLINFIKSQEKQKIFSKFLELLELKKSEIIERANTFAISGLLDQFMAYVVRKSKELQAHTDLQEFMLQLINTLQQYKTRIEQAPSFIANKVLPLIKNGNTILIFSFSHTIMKCIQQIVASNIDFKLIVVQSPVLNRDEKIQIGDQLQMLSNIGIRPFVVSEGGVTSIINTIDILLLGAEAMTQNCGLVNTIGTRQLAKLAFESKKTVIVATQFFKFCKFFCFTDQEFYLKIGRQSTQYVEESEYADYLQKYQDYTPPEWITWVATEVGLYTSTQAADQATLAFV
ncbi:Translation_initiation factor eIF-2B alpha subunit [Hexamita inflata]|uniref:Translation initiation factor eIF-2B alpha subunit n=1 Tax=Hexamita inflata TaxID=28002 RepID=A0AA86RL81_9EUKA|nr:Translation initiation factor eIF-2B alpha subunit [Hexamita inflata]